ncbi:hypothetical protein AB0B01_08615 [Streptomyces sp. NPDC044571]|uniref:hypothetical protein n=1 Tax=Streptomyces sp. NPDC044571 TaxID=3155371 RepID=UPI0033E70642
MLRAFFQENRDIGRLDVLADIAVELGLGASENHRIEGVPAVAQLRKAVLDAQAEQAVIQGAACGIDGC